VQYLTSVADEEAWIGETMKQVTVLDNIKDEETAVKLLGKHKVPREILLLLALDRLMSFVIYFTWVWVCVCV
jgi:non-canonical (house-cleaning) NTP pyrophosphatase